MLRDELEVTAAHAGQLGLWTVLGCNHRLTPPHRPHNSLYVISDEGALVGRYDKRFCSNTEINDWYSPGFEPLVFEVDGFKFGTMICIELAFPHLFARYEALGVDCVLFSTSGCDELTRVLTRAHAATNCYWISLSATARPGGAGGLVGPDGKFVTQSLPDGSAGLAVGVLDRLDARYDIALTKARPWRAAANQGEIYEGRRVDDPRSRDRVLFPNAVTGRGPFLAPNSGAEEIADFAAWLASKGTAAGSPNSTSPRAHGRTRPRFRAPG